jgi:hypothetical protein
MYICPLLLFCVIGGRLKNLKFLDLTFLLTVVYQLSEKKQPPKPFFQYCTSKLGISVGDPVGFGPDPDPSLRTGSGSILENVSAN